MIDDVLKDVRLAEAKADEMLKRAYQRGKDLVLRAETEAESQKKVTVSECKKDRAKILQHAREQADERTAAFLQRGAENAEYYIQDKQPAVDACADKVVKILLGKYIETEDTDEDGQPDSDGQPEVSDNGQTYQDWQ